MKIWIHPGRILPVADEADQYLVRISPIASSYE
jgi:hypothetical protein